MRITLAFSAGPTRRSALVLAELVGAVALAAVLAVDHGVGEAVGMAGSLPDGGMHDDGRVEADDVFAGAYHGLPPGVLDVALEFGAEGAVVPEAVDAAVEFGGLEDEAAPLAEGCKDFHVDVLVHSAREDAPNRAARQARGGREK